MAVYEGSRYAEAPILRTKGADGKSHPTIYYVSGSGGTYTYTNHVAEIGDRFDTLADRMWGDPELWWRVADLNPEIFYPGEIPVGTVLRIPR